MVSTKLITNRRQSSRFLKTNYVYSVFHSSMQLFSVLVAVAGTALLYISLLNSASAQTPKPSKSNLFGESLGTNGNRSVDVALPKGEKSISQVSVLFVNPIIGDDKALGSESAPFKTITHALRSATPNTVITLAKGTYSSQTGEIFPLILKPGVSIQGDAASKGRGILIQGGDDYFTRSYGKQNAAVVGANQSGLIGVTVTNPNPRGYGMLIESTNSTVSDSTFAGSIQDGIAVTGSGTPTISKNYFYRNGANGLTVSGTAKASVVENIFQQTGFGINIAQSAEPVIISNQIQSNRAGIIVQANARPKLRNNLIQGNREDGLVAIAQAMPDLGSASEPGGNDFRNNGRYDINASASKQIFSAAGNALATSRIAGKVDISGNTAPVAQNPQPTSAAAPGNEITFSAPETTTQLSNPGITTLPRRTIRNTPLTSQNRSTPAIPNIASNGVSSGLNSQLTPLQAANSLLNAATPRTNGFPTGNLPTSGQQNQATNDTAQINYVRVNPDTIEFTAPQAAPQQVAMITMPPLTMSPRPLQPMQTAPSLVTPNRLPIPTSDMSPLPAPQTAPLMGYMTPSLIASTGAPIGTSNGLRYRVVVPITSNRDEEIIRTVVPGAFRTSWRGQAVIQVGVFNSTSNAEQMIGTLNNNGLRGVIEALN
jgi:parallel beta-helix repeat protein